MQPGNINLKGIAEMAPPANYMEVRRFLGMTGFFWRFIRNYTRIAKPLNDILEGEASKLKSEVFTLPPDALDAFEKLKMCCMTMPVLAFAWCSCTHPHPVSPFPPIPLCGSTGQRLLTHRHSKVPGHDGRPNVPPRLQEALASSGEVRGILSLGIWIVIHLGED